MTTNRPSKRRRKLSEEDCTFSSKKIKLTRELLAHEIDLEIALLQRLENTIQTRIIWASLLQQSFTSKTSDTTEGHGSSEFKDIALDALRAIEEPCDLIFQRETQWPESAATSSVPVQQTAPPRTQRIERSSTVKPKAK